MVLPEGALEVWKNTLSFFGFGVALLIVNIPSLVIYGVLLIPLIKYKEMLTKRNYLFKHYLICLILTNLILCILSISFIHENFNFLYYSFVYANLLIEALTVIRCAVATYLLVDSLFNNLKKNQFRRLIKIFWCIVPFYIVLFGALGAILHDHVTLFLVKIPVYLTFTICIALAVLFFIKSVFYFKRNEKSSEYNTRFYLVSIITFFIIAHVIMRLTANDPWVLISIYFTKFFEIIAILALLRLWDNNYSNALFKAGIQGLGFASYNGNNINYDLSEYFEEDRPNPPTYDEASSYPYNPNFFRGINYPNEMYNSNNSGNSSTPCAPPETVPLTPVR